MSVMASWAYFFQRFEHMKRLPVFFISHGAPDIILQNDSIIHSWKAQLADLPKPKRILVISAHWETAELTVGGNRKQKTIHDFYGFPQVLYQYRYEPPEDCAWADALAQAFQLPTDHARGLDHGAWIPLLALFPEAEIPVTQLSVSPRLGASAHHALGKQLAPLRDQGVLILASGVIVHNLRALDWHHPTAAPEPWARQFMDAVDHAVCQGNHCALLDPYALPGASLALPTLEHYLPLLVACGAAGRAAEVVPFACEWRYRNLSYHSYRFE